MALADFGLYRPRKWAHDKKRRKRCGVSQDVRSRTRHDLTLEMLQ